MLHTASQGGKLKAHSTCVSHICAVLILYVPMIGLSLVNRFVKHSSPVIHITMADIYLLVPPILNPIIYSIKKKQIRQGFLLLLLLLLSPFSHVWLCVTPYTAAHQAPLSLGFSRQEHRSGLPFPSPMHESEKWKWSRSVVSDHQRPHGLQPSRLLHPWDFPGKSTGMGCHCPLQRLLRDIIIQNDQVCSHLEDIWSPFNLYIHFLHPEDNLSEILRPILYI